VVRRFTGCRDGRSPFLAARGDRRGLHGTAAGARSRPNRFGASPVRICPSLSWLGLPRRADPVRSTDH